MSARHLVKAATAALTELPMVNSASGLRPLVPPMETNEPRCVLQQRPGRARQPHVGEELQRVAVLPVGVGELEEAAALGGAGVVDQDVEMAELAPHRLDQRLLRALAAQVERRDRGLAALGADRRRGLVERGLVAPGQQEIAALGRKRQRDGPADAAARPGHQRDLAVQPQFHAPPFARLLRPGSLPNDPSGQARCGPVGLSARDRCADRRHQPALMAPSAIASCRARPGH